MLNNETGMCEVESNSSKLIIIIVVSVVGVIAIAMGVFIVRKKLKRDRLRAR